MASVFGHAIAAVAVARSFPERLRGWKFYVLGIVCSIWPDADVLGFTFGIPYDHVFGHRGFSHSIVFAVLTGIFVSFIFYRSAFKSKAGLAYILFFTLCTFSHSVLDAMTTGGLGVAFFAPFDNTRHFFPWRPIKVSPIGVEHFVGERAWSVIKSELLWVGLPSVVFMGILGLIRRYRKKTNLLNADEHIS